MFDVARTTNLVVYAGEGEWRRALAAAAALAAASSLAAEPLSLEKYLEQVREQNPEYRSARELLERVLSEHPDVVDALPTPGWAVYLGKYLGKFFF